MSAWKINLIIRAVALKISASAWDTNGAKSFLKGAQIFQTIFNSFSNYFQKYVQHIFPGGCETFSRGSRGRLASPPYLSAC